MSNTTEKLAYKVKDISLAEWGRKEITLAEAYNKAQTIKGQGDAEASRIYAAAYGKNAEFFAFYRSMDAYQKTFSKKTDVMVVDPSSDFFRYMKQAGSR